MNFWPVLKYSNANLAFVFTLQCSLVLRKCGSDLSHHTHVNSLLDGIGAACMSKLSRIWFFGKLLGGSGAGYSGKV